jgi:hypothetical protein
MEVVATFKPPELFGLYNVKLMKAIDHVDRSLNALLLIQIDSRFVP